MAYKSLVPDTAFELAKAALHKMFVCRITKSREIVAVRSEETPRNQAKLPFFGPRGAPGSVRRFSL